MTVADDADLVAQCLEGNRKAFDALLDRYEKPVYNLAYRMTRNAEDAVEIAQTVFLKAFEKLHTYDPSRAFFSWLYRIGVNECLNVKRKRRLEVVEPDQLERMAPEAQAESPLDRVAAEQLDRFIGEALSQLSPDYRMVLILRHYLEFSYQQMSDVLHIPAKTVKSRLYSARQRLRNVLAAEGILG